MMRLKRFAAICVMIFSSTSFAHDSWPPSDDHPLYKMPISELELADPALKACIMDWAERDLNVYRYVSDIREISCADKGIRSLEGLEALNEFVIAMDLSGNDIQDWSPILNFHHLGSIWLFDTEISCSSLAKLRKSIPKSWIAGVSWDTCIETEPTRP